jgi:hypothetical protein
MFRPGIAGARPPRLRAAVILAAAVSVAVGTAAPASAAPQPWNGRYQFTTFASQKAGTSPAARQREADFGGTFVLSTTCSVTRCVATVVDGPPPGNPTIPQPTRYLWNGSEWTTSYDWLWDCYVGNPTGTGTQKQWGRATSWAYYTPQADGSLRGTWHTDIAEGPCRGSVVMPVAATPA